MRKLLSLAVVAAAAVAMPGAASAATCLALNCDFTPGDDEFETAGDTTAPITGPVAATIGRTAIPAGVFTDTYRFIVDINGFGSGSISSSGTFGSVIDLDFTSVTINGTIIPITGAGTANESAGLSDVFLTAGVVNELIVIGTSRGLGSYGGNITFVPSAIPEPATWALMLAGFGGVGFGMRRRQKHARVQFA